MTTVTPEAVAAVYFDRWLAGDVAGLRELLADDVHFRGPLAELHDGDAAAEGLGRLAGITTRIDVRRRWVDGGDVITWFELHTSVAAHPEPVANWTHVEDGRITRILVTFDPRALAPPDAS